jgi:hypothetical protein
MASNQDPRSGWKRLEDSLLAMKPGEEITVDRLVSETGLARATVERVLEELAHSELFRKKAANVFVRRSLWETASGGARGSMPAAGVYAGPLACGADGRSVKRSMASHGSGGRMIIGI